MTYPTRTADQQHRNIRVNQYETLDRMARHGAGVTFALFLLVGAVAVFNPSTLAVIFAVSAGMLVMIFMRGGQRAQRELLELATKQRPADSRQGTGGTV